MELILLGSGMYMMMECMRMYSLLTVTLCGGIGVGTGDSLVRVGDSATAGDRLGIIPAGTPLIIMADIGDLATVLVTILTIIITIITRLMDGIADGFVRDTLITVLPDIPAILLPEE